MYGIARFASRGRAIGRPTRNPPPSTKSLEENQSLSGPGSNSAPPLPADPNFGALRLPLFVRGGFAASGFRSALLGSTRESRLSGSSMFAFRSGSAEVVSIASFSSSVDRGIVGPVSLSSAIPSPIKGWRRNGAWAVPETRYYDLASRSYGNTGAGAG